MSIYDVKRREFLKMAGLVGAGLSTGQSSLFNLKNLGALAGINAAKGDDYKALVCVYLGGGADSYNMLVPRSVSEYNVYQATRSNLALNLSDLLPINPMNNGGIDFGLHPMMTGVQSLFNDGKACVLANVGTLVDYISKDEYYNELKPVPLGLFSHSDQTNQWQTASPGERLIKGWAGRISDMIHDVNDNDLISMNMSFNGTNTFQSSNLNVEYSINNNGAITLNGYGDMYGQGIQKTIAIDKMLSRSYTDPLKETYTKNFKTALDSNLFFNEKISEVPEFSTQFSESYMSGNMSMIAKIIAAREELGFKRQIFYLDVGNWDNHDNLTNDLSYNLMSVDNALTEFNNVLKEMGLEDCVVTFTMSEFGRTLTSNGNGTDHAWGGNAFVMGGPVRGNRIFGEFPDLALQSPLDIGGGVIIPTTPNDLYFAELAIWLGVPQGELHTIFPNLGNFYAQGSTNAPLGFLNL